MENNSRIKEHMSIMQLELKLMNGYHQKMRKKHFLLVYKQSKKGTKRTKSLIMP